MRHILTFFLVAGLVASFTSCDQAQKRQAEQAQRQAEAAQRQAEAAQASVVKAQATAAIDSVAATAPAAGPVETPAATGQETSTEPFVEESQPADVAAAGEPEAETAAGAALTTIFSPARAPQRKTMGLLQRSFLDIAAQGDQELEVAIVVDGTDSMRTDLAGVRESISKMLDDLRKFRTNKVSASIVIYRDDKSPSGPYSIPNPFFTDDKEAFDKSLEKLTPEDGKPYFNELPDLGINQAIHELQWSDDPQVAKWILLFGDAPPYSESRREGSARYGHRRFATDILVSAAKAKGIRINCVLCTSTKNVASVYEQAINQTRSFMNELSGGTDGLMLDLSYPQIHDKIVEAAKRPEVGYAEINPITAIDLASVQRDDINTQEDAGKVANVSIAVLPHVPLDQMRTVGFDPSNKAVQVSTALRSKLEQLSGVSVTSPVDIQLQLRRLRSANVDPKQALRGLAAQLRVDYIVWGEPVATGASYHTTAYRRDNGKMVVEVDLPGDVDQGTWAHIFLTAASTQSGDQEEIGKLLKQIDGNAASKKAMTTPMAKSTATSGQLLEALEALDQALAYDTGDEVSSKLLKTADRASKEAAVAEPRNPIARWLQANVAYNQAAHLFQKGDREAATERMKDMKTSLDRAIRERESISSPSLLTEIEGDHYLLVRKDVTEAIKRYEQLTQPDQPLPSQLRGHWMLSGIYAGDWGNAESSTVDSEKARMHVMQIMANWPNSPQDKLLRNWLKYDETSKQTEFNYLPMVNVELTGT